MWFKRQDWPTSKQGIVLAYVERTTTKFAFIATLASHIQLWGR